MADYEAEQLWRSFQADPVGTYQAIGSELAEAGVLPDDPRIAEMYADFEQQRNLAAYDAAIAEIVNDPANADINPNRLHQFVAAADGDFGRALEMYRADTAEVLTTYGLDPGLSRGETAQPVPVDRSPVDSLHRAIEEAARASRWSR